MGKPPARPYVKLLGGLLILLVLLAYLPALRGGFLWDDNDHISNNRTLRSLGGLWEIWFQPGARANIIP